MNSNQSEETKGYERSPEAEDIFNWSVWVLILGIAASAIIGLILIYSDIVGYGLIVIFAGVISSFISSAMLKGFSRLVENSDKIVNSLSKLVENGNISNEKMEQIRKSSGFSAKLLRDIFVENNNQTKDQK